MLSVIIDARRETQRLPALLAQLTSGVVEGLVREVFIVAEHSEYVSAICEDMGAEDADSVEAALAWAKSEVVLALPADLRLRDGWTGELTRFLSAGGTGALVRGVADGGLFRSVPTGVLVERDRVVALERPDLQRLRRKLGFRPARIG